MLLFLTLGIMAGVSLAFFVDAEVFTLLLMTGAIMVTAFINRRNPNIFHLCLFLCLLKVIEQRVFLNMPIYANYDLGELQVWVNHKISMIHVGFQLMTIFILAFRAPISRMLYNREHVCTSKIVSTNADITLLPIYVLYFLLDLLHILENLIRNLEHMEVAFSFDIFGYTIGWGNFSLEFAKNFWDWTFIWDNYKGAKRVIMGMEIFVIVTMSIAIMKQEFKKENLTKFKP